jgi:hypothetical protein
MLGLSMALFVGCNKPGDEDKDGGAKHVHPTAGPHGGALVEWGDEEYHVEVIVDRAKQEVRAYILGPDAKTATPIKTDKLVFAVAAPKFEVELKPERQENDPTGKASVFTAKHAHFGKEPLFRGEVRADIEGTPYDGTFEEKPAKKK